MSCNSCSHSHVVPNIGGVDPSRSRPCHHVRPADFKHHDAPGGPLNQAGAPAPGPGIRFPPCKLDALLQFGTLILLGQIGNVADILRYSWAISVLALFPILHCSSCATLQNRSKALYISIEFSAERIGLGRESGLADDLLQNPISNRRCSGAATRIPVEGRQRTWPQEL